MAFNDTGELNLRERLASIDRALAENVRAREEAQKFIAEQHKLLAEASKLSAESYKFQREAWWYPALAIAGMLGGLLGIATFIAKVIHG